MSPLYLIAFEGVGFEIFVVAWVTLAILIAALLAAAANSFFRNVGRFDDVLREATMDLAPAERRRFFELYESRRPKNPAVAWFLAVAFGPAGANLYRGKWPAFFAAVVSLNGLGAWWLESWFTSPHLVALENRKLIEWTQFVLRSERSEADVAVLPEPVPQVFRPVLVTR